MPADSIPLPEVSNDTRERMSLAFVRLVDARHTCFVTSEEGGDMAKIDATLQSAWQPRRIFTMQLKATSSPLTIAEGEVAYDLDASTYNTLRRRDATVPQLLVVLPAAERSGDWLTVDADAAIVRRCAWWTDLWGDFSGYRTLRRCA